MIDTEDKSSCAKKWLALLAGAALIALRAPNLFSDPRFWAEDGALFELALQSGTWETLTRAFPDYLPLFSNLGAWLATKLPLASAPLAPTLVAFACQLMPLIVILWGSSALWGSGWKRYVACALVIFTMPSGEVWLTPINSQFHLALTSFLILAETGAMEAGGSRRHRFFMRGLLLAGGLAGLAPCLLAPFFAVRSAVERNRERIIQTCFLGTGVLVQVWMHFAHKSYAPDRAKSFDLDVLSAGAFIKLVPRPVLPPQWTYEIAMHLRALGQARELAFLAVVCGVVTLLWVFFFGRASSGARRAMPRSVVAVVVLAALFGGNQQGRWTLLQLASAERYFYLPAVVLGLAALSNVSSERPLRSGFKSASRALFCLLILGAGALWFRHPRRLAADFAPSWKAEVEAWRETPDRPLSIWPRPFQVRLPVSNLDRRAPGPR